MRHKLNFQHTNPWKAIWDISLDWVELVSFCSWVGWTPVGLYYLRQKFMFLELENLHVTIYSNIDHTEICDHSSLFIKFWNGVISPCALLTMSKLKTFRVGQQLPLTPSFWPLYCNILFKILNKTLRKKHHVKLNILVTITGTSYFLCTVITYYVWTSLFNNGAKNWVWLFTCNI